MKNVLPLIIVCLTIGAAAGYAISIAAVPALSPSHTPSPVQFGSEAVSNDLIIVESPLSADESLDVLTQALTASGATIFARIDHAAGAASIGEVLPPTQVLIFGNPTLGTALIQARPLAALDLPVRVLAWENEAGGSTLAYLAPQALAARYDITDRAPQIDRMTAVLEALTGSITAE